MSSIDALHCHHRSRIKIPFVDPLYHKPISTEDPPQIDRLNNVVATSFFPLVVPCPNSRPRDLYLVIFDYQLTKQCRGRILYHCCASSSSDDTSATVGKPKKKTHDRLSGVIDAVNDRKLLPELRGQRNNIRSETDIINVVEQRIWHLMEECQFDNLQGKGKPLNLNNNRHAGESGFRFFFYYLLCLGTSIGRINYDLV
ncbi:unnamed protein product [Lactuca virosa]|uniref:Uncharacterized protein n=1 Tax=Lactuca virosa TaxID=75947 RepID=A0AAU9LCI8_9ASTR|nr:unnamed protein product [Lactuca virosa]